MKKIFYLLIVFLLMGCGSTNVIKEDYEKLNDKYIKIEVDDNHFEKIDLNKIDEIIKGHGLIYFCLPTSNYCRNNLNIVIEIINDLEIEKVYYVDITDLRDVFDDNLNISHEGTEEYHNFLSKYGENLSSLNNHKYIFDGDILLFDNSNVIDYLTVNNYNVSITDKLSEEEKKIEYKRLYNVVSKLNDPEACNQDDTGC